VIVRLHRNAALHLATILFFVAAALTARATTPVLESHMRQFVYFTIGVSLFAAMGSGAAFVSYLLSRMERAMQESDNRLDARMERIEKAAADISLNVDRLLNAQVAATEKIADEANRIGQVEHSLSVLCTEHNILHGALLGKVGGETKK
jgi:hypothetical protein